MGDQHLAGTENRLGFFQVRAPAIAVAHHRPVPRRHQGGEGNCSRLQFIHSLTLSLSKGEEQLENTIVNSLCFNMFGTGAT